MRRRELLFGLIASGVLAAKSKAAPLWAESDSTLLSKGSAKTSLGSAYFEVHGAPAGPPLFMAGPVFSRTSNPANTALQTQIKEGYIQRLGDRYKLLMSDYPHIAPTQDQDEIMTVEHVCKDYLAIADAAKIDRFAAIGYSWGGNTVLQLATRSQRVNALAVGGWPAIDGPYEHLLETTEKLHRDSPERPEVIRFVNYYRSLHNWPERAEVAKLKCPRLNYIDAGDAGDTDFIGRFRKNKKVLQELGWEATEINSGSGHPGGLMPEIACPVIGTFLDKHLLPGKSR
jgi:pimeloyl-ACP methyl ester carboxylesterase